MSKAVSVIIIPGSEAETLLATVHSVLSQSRANFQLLVSVDNGDDKIYNQLRAIRDGDSRLLVHEYGSQTGSISILNKLLKQTKHEFLSVLQSGNQLQNDALEKMCYGLESDADVMMATCAYKLVSNSGKLLTTIHPEFPSPVLDKTEYLKKFNGEEKLLPPLDSIMFRRIDKSIAFRSEYTYLAPIIFCGDILNQSSNAKVLGIDTELASIRHFPQLERKNRAEESMMAAADSARLVYEQTEHAPGKLLPPGDSALALFAPDKRMERLTGQFTPATREGLASALRALNIYLDELDYEHASYAVESMSALAFNRITRKHSSKTNSAASQAETARLDEESRALKAEAERILQSRTWRLADKLRTLVGKFVVKA
jgi:glycosyltransferase involved in cell wall biosynthesis